MKRVQVKVAGVPDEKGTQDKSILTLQETEGFQFLQIRIGRMEADNIAIGIMCTKQERPLAHDLMKNIIDRALGRKLREVEIHDYGSDGTFYARLIFESRETVDARPSDAVALALRCNVPIYVKGKVMAKRAVGLKDLKEEREPVPVRPPEKKWRPGGRDPIQILSGELQDAIDREEYERAGKIRDEIRRRLRMDEEVP